MLVHRLCEVQKRDTPNFLFSENLEMGKCGTPITSDFQNMFQSDVLQSQKKDDVQRSSKQELPQLATIRIPGKLQQTM